MSSFLTQLPFALDEWEFEFQQRASHPVLMADLWCRALWSEYASAIGLPVSGLDYLFTGLSKGYVKKVQKARVLELLRQSTDQNRACTERILQNTQAAVGRFEMFAENSLRLFKENPSSFDLVPFWSEFVQESERLIPWFYIPWYLTEENILSERVRAGLEPYREQIESVTDFSRALAILCSPVKILELQKERERFFALVAHGQRSEDLKHDQAFQQMAHEYLQEFDWMNTFFVLPVEPLTFSVLVERVEVALRDRALETYELQQKEQYRQKELFARLQSLIVHDEVLMKDVLDSQELAWILTWSVERALRAFARFIPLYRQIAQKLGVSYERWVCLTIDEIAEGLRSSSVPAQDVLQQRVKAYVFCMERGRSMLIGGEEAQRCTQAIESRLHAVGEDIRELRGQVASPGTVRGRARIARFAQDSYRVEKGEVLVCSMTSPDYVPAMQRAGAIVTDEGGLLSHASIVSRELGKPCVVGTKIATKALQDGDLVEVEAEKGIVRILERTSS